METTGPSTNATALMLPVASGAIAIGFLALLPFRLRRLYRSDVKVRATWIGPAKSGLAVAITALLVTTLSGVLRAPSLFERWNWLASAIGSSCIAALGLSWLLFVEHRRSVRPSGLALSYLLASVICESIWVAVPGKAAQNIGRVSSGVFLGQLCFKFVLLIMEARGKERSLYSQYQGMSPEDTAGIARGVLFWWINPLLVRGMKNTLTNNDLPSTGTSLSSEGLSRAMVQSWERRTSPKGSMTLLLALLRCLAHPFLLAVPCRLFVIVFQYAQPILIRHTISYVSQKYAEMFLAAGGFWILVAACFTYIGLAFSTAIYQHRLNNLRVMSRGALVGIIYERVFDVRSDLPETGSAITLMSTDVDSLCGVLGMLLEILGYTLGVIIGMIMLWREIGLLSFLPLVLILLGSRVTRYVAQNLRTKQKDWSNATQDRITAISSMLGSMKAIKALGLSETTASRIRHLRTDEISKANKIRWLMVIYNSSANALGIFTPMLTVILYAITGDGSIDVETAFTTVALLTMVMHPANMLMTLIPRVIASFASFERIQTYLLESTRHDKRSISHQAEISLEHTTIDTFKTFQPALRDMNMVISSPSIVSVSGPVGSGKSLFAKVLLGEVPFSQGAVTLPTRRIGLCTQSPWLPDGTIRDVVCSFESEVDELWYEKVITSCCLAYDLALLPEGDGTTVGTRGMNLSGGQRQRVALARLLYARCQVAILDDTFSALDKKTGDLIIRNLLADDGIFRKLNTTVFWLGNSTSYSHFADRNLVLEDGELREERLEQPNSPETQDVLHDEAHGEVLAEDITDTPQAIKKLQVQRRAREDASDDLSRKTGDLALYGLYFRYAGIANTLIMLLCAASCSFFITFPQYWLVWWTDAGSEHSAFYITGYAIFDLIAWASTSCTMWVAYLLMAATSGRKLHQILLKSVIGAPLSFFSENDIGRTLNRFSQDIQLIDTELASASMALANQICKLIVQVGILITVQKLLLFTLPICGAIVYFIQKVYLHTSRQVRLLDLESRSAVFSSFLETVDGVVTIRAFGWEQRAKARNLAHLDESQRAAYTLFCLQRWLNLVLDLTVAGIAIGLIALAVIFRDTTSGGAVGVALNIVLITNTTLLRLVESWTNLEISLSAISRLKQMQRETSAEDQPWEDLVPSEDWPSAGQLGTRSVDAFYNPETMALRDISLSISPGQKVLLCGRTGSGKSTFLLVLLRLVEQTGVVKVDGVDIARVPRAILRQRCFITIPQDPFLLPNSTLRFNLDPGQTAQDDVLIRALKSVRLWSVLSLNGTNSALSSLDTALSSLDTALSFLPVLSAGQSQLLALARALVKRESLELQWGTKPVLLLDEATSSLDPATEEIIHEVIDERFTSQGHTVVMITHRPHAAASRMRRDRDVVVWMKDGRVERMGSVEEALQSV